ncbi:hypothetical protein [Mycolicibacterium sp.]|uniref:hypothetical protein n=1 Tax=Mycolicibacterium sp. TaxID=2320850 RepID=UPI003D1531D4
MRIAYGALPCLAAGAVAAAAVAAAVIPAAVAGAATSGGAPITGLMTPLPQTYPWCELDLYCYDDDLDLVLETNRDRHRPNYGGGPADPDN